MSLEKQLELQRLPGRNKPVGVQGNRLNTAQELAKQNAFKAMKANGIEAEEKYRKSKEQEEENYKNDILNGKGRIGVSSESELIKILGIIGNNNSDVLLWFKYKLELQNGCWRSLENRVSRSFMSNDRLTLLATRMGLYE